MPRGMLIAMQKSAKSLCEAITAKLLKEFFDDSVDLRIVIERQTRFLKRFSFVHFNER